MKETREQSTKQFVIPNGTMGAVVNREVRATVLAKGRGEAPSAGLLTTKLRWTCSTSFSTKDRCKTRKDNAPLGLSIVRHAAFNILKADQSKGFPRRKTHQGLHQPKPFEDNYSDVTLLDDLGISALGVMTVLLA